MTDTLHLSLCNELLAADGLSLAEQCRVAADLGYMGLELAPGSIDPVPHRLSDGDWRAVRRTVEGHGLRITGLHWLLAPYPDLSITESARIASTVEVLTALVEAARILGADVLVHGSPSSRRLPEGVNGDNALETAARALQPVAEAAASAGVTYCIEPLSPAETSFVNTVQDARVLVRAMDSPAFQTMIDTSAAGQAEAVPVAELIRREVPHGGIAHIQVNDTNRGAPGMGEDPFDEIARALREVGWSSPIAVEPFRTQINGTVTAAIGAATMRASWRAAR